MSDEHLPSNNHSPSRLSNSVVVGVVDDVVGFAGVLASVDPDVLGGVDLRFPIC